MLTEVEKPIGEVVKSILEYTDPENGFHIFGVIGFCSNGESLTYIASLDDPETLTGHEYSINHSYHSENCVIKDPKDPRYLNASATIAAIDNWGFPETTRIRWRSDYIKDENHGPGYKKLDALLASL